MFKRAALTLAILGMVASASAQPQRTLLVRERSLPAARSFEIGTIARYAEEEVRLRGMNVGTADVYGFEPYVRYGLADNLSVHLAAPLLRVSSPWTGSHTGIGDLRLGADLLVFEDIFRYPWIIPYADVTLPTGDEDKGLGLGETGLFLGIAVGTRMYDVIGLSLDGRRDMVSGMENISSIGGAITWDLNDEFSLLAEGRIYERRQGQSSPSKQFLAGMVYWPTPNWMVGAYGGQHRNGSTDTVGQVKVSYLIPFP